MASSRTKNFVDLRNIKHVEDNGVLTVHIEPRGMFKEKDPKLTLYQLQKKWTILFTYRNGGTWIQENLGSHYFEEFDNKFIV
jgi:hypothetical protein